MESLKKRGFEPYFCETAGDAVKLVLSLVDTESSVSWGGSLTLEETGIIRAVKEKGCRVIDRAAASSPEEKEKLLRQAFFCDWYLSGINAVSEDGIMVNIDGIGNRVAAIAFGPKHVILVAGMNKVVRDGEAARQRAWKTAAPANAVRLNTNTPCAKTGCCQECLSPDCICGQIVEMRKNRIPGRIRVILINQDLGL